MSPRSCLKKLVFTVRQRQCAQRSGREPASYRSLTHMERAAEQADGSNPVHCNRFSLLRKYCYFFSSAASLAASFASSAAFSACFAVSAAASAAAAVVAVAAASAEVAAASAAWAAASAACWAASPAAWSVEAAAVSAAAWASVAAAEASAAASSACFWFEHATRAKPRARAISALLKVMFVILVVDGATRRERVGNMMTRPLPVSSGWPSLFCYYVVRQPSRFRGRLQAPSHRLRFFTSPARACRTCR